PVGRGLILRRARFFEWTRCPEARRRFQAMGLTASRWASTLAREIAFRTDRFRTPDERTYRHGHLQAVHAAGSVDPRSPILDRPRTRPAHRGHGPSFCLLRRFIRGPQ